MKMSKKPDIDYLVAVEDEIHRVRLTQGFTPTKLVEMGYVAPTIYRIERHGNYVISTLFSLLADLGLELTFNGSRVGDITSLGSSIRRRREELGMSQLDVIYQTGIYSTRVIAVEQGRGYEKKTLNAYLSVLDTTINVTEKQHG